jgi:hypothetical protein
MERLRVYRAGQLAVVPVKNVAAPRRYRNDYRTLFLGLRQQKVAVDAVKIGKPSDDPQEADEYNGEDESESLFLPT